MYWNNGYNLGKQEKRSLEVISIQYAERITSLGGRPQGRWNKCRCGLSVCGSDTPEGLGKNKNDERKTGETTDRQVGGQQKQHVFKRLMRNPRQDWAAGKVVMASFTKWVRTLWHDHNIEVTVLMGIFCHRCFDTAILK